MQKEGVYDKIRPHGGGEDISKIDASTGGDGGIPIAPGTFTAESIDQSFAGEEGPQGGNVTPESLGMSTTGGGDPFYAGGRAGYNRGRVVNPGGYAGDTDFTTWLQKQDIDIKTLNLDDLTSLQLEWDKVRPKHIKQADGGRVRFFYGGIATAL